jgi:drug/metabolite transporter (DMT)-like permease
MAFSWLLMGERVSGTFWIALGMVAAAVLAGSADSLANRRSRLVTESSAPLSASDPKH